MSLDKFFTDRTSFESTETIKGYIVNSKHYQEDNESLERSNALLFFNTPNQHTWLVATEQRLYCIIDDLRKSRLHINWSIKKDDIVSGNKIVLPLNVREKTKKTGMVDIGKKHRGWLFTQKLFLSQPVDTMIKKLLQRSMILHEFK